jgi:glucose dehydrogenase
MRARLTNKRLAILLLIFTVFAIETRAQVTFERILDSSKEPQNWLTYSGDYAGRRFSSLDQVNTANAHSLVAKWVYQTAATGKLETTALVVD